MKIFTFLICVIIVITNCNQEVATKSIVQSIDQWTYVEVDSSKTKWGDYAEPEWLRYFGLDVGDVNGDNKDDIISGRNVYLQTQDIKSWTRYDLGLNVDGMLVTDIDGDDYKDIIAEALPNVYWIEASNKIPQKWNARVIAQIPPTSHHNGQGYRTTKLTGGPKDDILLSSQKGIYLIKVPSNPSNTNDWGATLIAANASDEGFAVGDIDGDGDMDIASGRRIGEASEPKQLVWFENNGDFSSPWQSHDIAVTMHPIDRVEIADLDGYGNNEIIISEERYPGLEPDASLRWFKQNSVQKWTQQKIVTQYSMNNLDVADIDMDGDVDIITCEHKGKNLELQIWKNDGKANFEKQLVDSGKESHLGARLYDIDHDGDLDIVSTAWDQHQYMHLWINNAK